MKLKYYFSVFLLFVTTLTNAQMVFNPTLENPNDAQTILRNSINKFQLYSLDIAAFNDYVKSSGTSAQFKLQLDGIASLDITIFPYDILSPDYTLVVGERDGQKNYPKRDCITYRGYITNNPESKVALTITDNTVYGFITFGNEEYFIEPLSYFDKTVSTNQLVVYNIKDVAENPNLTCGVVDAKNVDVDKYAARDGEPLAGSTCYRVRMAIASDASMFARYGSVAAVEIHNIGVMNNVMWDYVNSQFNDNFEFVIVTQNISTIATGDQLSPVYSGTNANTILGNFRTWGNSGGFGAVSTFDIGQFWTTRNIDDNGAGNNSGIIGLAYVGVRCNNANKYQLLEDFTGVNNSGNGYQLRVLTTHELGHNFGANHDASGSPYIMAPSVQNTSLWSAASITSINAGPTSCLLSCDAGGLLPIANFSSSTPVVCVGGTFNFLDRTLRGPTTWTWSFPGGTPNSSTSRNPSVTYATAGSKPVTLTVTNANGSHSITKNVVVSAPAASACTSPGTSTSNAGIRYFGLNSISKNSGSAAVDGNRYVNNSCTDLTTLALSTTYDLQVNLGYYDAVGGNHLFNFFSVMIDYNNDGVFSNSEIIYTSSQCWAGTVTSSFTTPATVPVSNQILRLRIVADECSNLGNLGPCMTVASGQVEDYGVIFVTNNPVPVTLLNFEGVQKEGNNHLIWEVAKEENFSHYEVERSNDGKDFNKIGSVNIKQSTALNNNYEFVDNQAKMSSKNFYRIKMVDLDGSFSHSHVVTLQNKIETASVVAFPNPFNDNLIIKLNAEKIETLKIKVVDILGKEILTTSENVKQGEQTILLNQLSHLVPGSYILIIESEKEKVYKQIQKVN